MTLEATVVVCTVRHAADVVDALASAVGQTPAPSEVILVRSGTAVGTPLPDHLAEQIRGMPVRVVVEPRAGVAAARARGLVSSRHDVVLYLDDDAVAQAGWYAALTDVMTDDAVAAAGGTIVPRWPAGRPPRWLPNGLRSAYGERLPGSVHQPFGANMAVRRPIVEGAGGIPLALGHDRSTPGVHEETALCERLLSLGHRVEDVPGAVVHHHVRSDQVRVQWLLRRAWHEGRSDLGRDRYLRRPPAAGVHAAKLMGLVLVLPLSLVRTRWSVHVAARVLANAGYLTAWARRSRN